VLTQTVVTGVRIDEDGVSIGTNGSDDAGNGGVLY